MFIITKEYHFSASHCIPSLKSDNPCARMHGHNYTVKLELRSETLNEHGFVRDYKELAPLKDYIDETPDHRHLNDVLGDNKTSTEYLAKHLYDWSKKRWPEVSAVHVMETPKNTAEYRP